MGEERNDSHEAQHVAERGQSKGREDNAAVPPRTMDQDVDPGSYPPARVDDAVELVRGGAGAPD
jgi:hypothetical protein